MAINAFTVSSPRPLSQVGGGFRGPSQTLALSHQLGRHCKPVLDSTEKHKTKNRQVMGAKDQPLLGEMSLVRYRTWRAQNILHFWWSTKDMGSSSPNRVTSWPRGIMKASSERLREWTGESRAFRKWGSRGSRAQWHLVPASLAAERLRKTWKHRGRVSPEHWKAQWCFEATQQKESDKTGPRGPCANPPRWVRQEGPDLPVWFLSTVTKKDYKFFVTGRGHGARESKQGASYHQREMPAELLGFIWFRGKGSLLNIF